MAALRFLICAVVRPVRARAVDDPVRSEFLSFIKLDTRSHWNGCPVRDSHVGPHQNRRDVGFLTEIDLLASIGIDFNAGKLSRRA